MNTKPDIGEINGLTRRWLTESRPGTFRADDLAGLWAAVWQRFRHDVDLPATVPHTVVYDLEYALARVGVTPERDGGGAWTLELPEPAETAAV